MTNTLHRFGDADSFRDDYVVFAIASRGKNDEDSVPKLKKFLEIARRFSPVNLGDARHGGALRPSRRMNPLSHWKRDVTPDFEAVVAGLDTTTTAAAVFDNRAAAEDFVKAIREADLGLERQHFDVDRRGGAVLRCGASLSSQRRILARFRGKDGAPAKRGRAQTRDHVRPRNGQRIACQEDDRLGKRRTANARTGCHLPDPVLLMRRIQSGAR